MFLVCALACFAIRTQREVANLTLFFHSIQLCAAVLSYVLFFLDDIKLDNFYGYTFNGDPVSAI